jgi:hypothetical protein
MNDSKDIDPIVIEDEAINKSVWGNNNFANISRLAFGN